MNRLVLGLSVLLVAALPLMSFAQDDMEIALEGSVWALVSYVNAEGEMVDALPGTQVTLELIDGQASGSAGCNQYFGSYTLSGEALTFSETGSTMMACMPEEKMQQEADYLAALLGVTTYQLNDNQLVLLDAAGETIITFELLEPAPLVGTTWVMTTFVIGGDAMTTPLQGTEITALFAEDGRLGGSAGCNNYTASYTVDGSQLTISPAAATRKLCSTPEGVMDQEAAYLASLEQVAAFEIRADVLTLSDAQGLMLAQFRARSELVGVKWQWQAVSDSAGEMTPIDNPEAYTLLFNTDGSISFRADCNTGSATYTRSGSDVRIQPGVMTLAMCPPESLSEAFLAHLESVTTFEVVDGNLLLSPGTEGETLHFAPAG